MAKDLYPHLTVEVNTEFMYADLVHKLETAGRQIFQIGKPVREEGERRSNALNKWLIDHGYKFGQDYARKDTYIYRFASESLATMFLLGNAK